MIFKILKAITINPSAILYQPKTLKSYFLTKPTKNFMARSETTNEVIIPIIKTDISLEVIAVSV